MKALGDSFSVVVNSIVGRGCAKLMRWIAMEKWNRGMIVLVLCFWGSLSGYSVENDPALRIQPWSENPRYWQYQGKPVLLIGGSDEDNLFNQPELMRANFALCEQVAGNYIRSTLSCRDEGNVWPFAKVGDRYDLTQFNPEFWDRLETSLREAHQRDIIVQIEVWATFDYYRDIWARNPFNPANNNTYTTQNTQLVTEWDFHPASKVQSFFFSIPEKNNDVNLLKIQQSFVRKVLEVSLPYPNVLYCLDNETRAPQEWAHYWAKFLHEEAAQLGKSIQLTEMWDIWDILHEDHRRTYDFPNLFSYVDISQNNWQVGQVHYDNLMKYRAMLPQRPGGIRPMNNVKVYGRRVPSEPCITELNLDRWWQNLFAGCASSRFHRPETGLGLNLDAQKAIQTARALFKEFDIFHSEPSPDLLLNREENEAYCLAIPLHNQQYAVYFPKGGEIDLKVSLQANPLRMRWINMQTTALSEPVIADFKKEGNTCTIHLQSPDREQTWLVLIQ